jgi:hypothetical protein
MCKLEHVAGADPKCKCAEPTTTGSNGCKNIQLSGDNIADLIKTCHQETCESNGKKTCELMVFNAGTKSCDCPCESLKKEEECKEVTLCGKVEKNGGWKSGQCQWTKKKGCKCRTN